MARQHDRRLSYTGYGEKGEIEDHLAQVQAPLDHAPISFNGQEHLGFGQVSVTLQRNSLVASNFGSNTPDGLAIALSLPAQQITLQLDPVSLSTPGTGITFQVFEPARRSGGIDFEPPELLSQFSLVNRSNALELTSSFWDYDWWWCFTEIPAQ